MCQAGFSSLTAENCSDEVEGKYKVLTECIRFQLHQLKGNFSTQHFFLLKNANSFWRRVGSNI